MAKIIEDQITIKFSKLVKDENSDDIILDGEVTASIEAIIQELVGDNIIVELK